MRRSVLILALVGFSSAIRCHLYHDIVEAGKRMIIIPDICSSEKYCVHATYKDNNKKKKNGFSQGCDRVDCRESENPLNTAWKRRDDNSICRKHRDYGEKGEVCCCTTELCNSSSLPATFIVYIISSITVLYYNELF